MTVEPPGGPAQSAECTVMGEFAFCSLFSISSTQPTEDTKVGFMTYSSLDPSVPGDIGPGPVIRHRWPPWHRLGQQRHVTCSNVMPRRSPRDPTPSFG